MSSVTECSSSLKQKLFRLAVHVFIIHHCLCCYGYSYVLSSIHLDLGCTHTRGSDLCLSTIDPQFRSPDHFTCVTALYRVQCGSFNHALARLKRWLGCGTHVVSMKQLMYYFCMRYCYHYDSKNHYIYLDITLLNGFNSSDFRFTMALVLISLMNVL